MGVFQNLSNKSHSRFIVWSRNCSKCAYIRSLFTFQSMFVSTVGLFFLLSPPVRTLAVAALKERCHGLIGRPKVRKNSNSTPQCLNSTKLKHAQKQLLVNTKRTSSYRFE